MSDKSTIVCGEKQETKIEEQKVIKHPLQVILLISLLEF